jgi:hypothetical protein
MTKARKKLEREYPRKRGISVQPCLALAPEDGKADEGR